MNEGANCAKTEPLPSELPQIQNEIEWRKRSTAISVDTLLATANATDRPKIAENVYNLSSFFLPAFFGRWRKIDIK